MGFQKRQKVDNFYSFLDKQGVELTIRIRFLWQSIANRMAWLDMILIQKNGLKPLNQALKKLNGSVLIC